MNKDPQTYALIGAAMEVPKHLGHGFLEAVYQEALACGLAALGIPFINALKATGLQRALSINFGAPSLDYKRLVFNLRESAQSADKLNEPNLTGVQLG